MLFVSGALSLTKWRGILPGGAFCFYQLPFSSKGPTDSAALYLSSFLISGYSSWVTILQMSMSNPTGCFWVFLYVHCVLDCPFENFNLIQYIFYLSWVLWGVGMAQLWEHLSPITLAQVQFLPPQKPPFPEKTGNWMKRHPVDLSLRFSLFLCEELSFWRQIVQKRNGQAEENLMAHLTEKRKLRKKSQTAAINWLLPSSKACATKDSFQAWAVQSWLMPFNLKWTTTSSGSHWFSRHGEANK